MIYIYIYTYPVWYICCDMLRIAIEWNFSDFGGLDQISIYNIWKKCTHKYIELIGLVDLVSVNTWWQRIACVCRKHAQGRRLALFLMKRSSHRPGVLCFSKFAFWLYIHFDYCLLLVSGNCTGSQDLNSKGFADSTSCDLLSCFWCNFTIFLHTSLLHCTETYWICSKAAS